MVGSALLKVLFHIFLLSHGFQSSASKEELSPHLDVLDLPWHDELCCDSPVAHLLPDHPHCSFKSRTPGPDHQKASGGICVDILCRIQNWENVTCDLQPHSPPSTTLDPVLKAMSLQRLSSDKDLGSASYNPVVCKAKDSFTCSLALDGLMMSFVTMVTVSISDTVAPPVLLRVPARPVKPSPPVNLSHNQTIEAELILRWDDPSDVIIGPLRYEVRYSPNATHPVWQVIPALEEPRLSLDLRPKLKYIIQVRCSSLVTPPLWSDWSEPYHIFLGTVTYIPEQVVARPGQKVTVYCVFNDRNMNASAAVWRLNFRQRLHQSQYHPVNQWVSQITMRPSGTRMYDLLQCTQEWNIPYSQIFVEGASIGITCETNSDITAMYCSWENTLMTVPTLRARWADMSCDEMEKAGDNVREVEQVGATCQQARFWKKTCATIYPLRMTCYKLWLEVPSRFRPIRSKPAYVSPRDHVKPHTPTDLRAVTLSGAVLSVTWEQPYLPVHSFLCQFRYRLPSSVKAPQEWKVQSPVTDQRAEVAVPDMCAVYEVEFRCRTYNLTGYWSKWSESIYSTPQSSRAPERGPDFWRILRDDPYRNQTNVTLVFEPLQMLGHSYCVDGFIVQHQTSSGSVVREQIDLASTYSFEWDQSLQTVTVEAYNNMGSSVNNFNMMLERQLKRRCVRSFSVLAINSTCVSLSWSLLDNSSVPLFMVVQWSPLRQEGSDHHKGQSGETWARLPYTDRPVYLRGDFCGSEECGFHLYPVFADGEGEPAYFIAATRGDPAAYMLLMIISFLSIVLFVTLVLSQNQMKKIVWKDVPNPNKCSWARGLDLKKVDTFEHLFRPPDGLPAWPLLMPSENISKVVIVDKVDLSGLTSALTQAPHVTLTSDSASTSSSPTCPGFHSEADPSPPTKIRAPSFVLNIDDFTGSNTGADQLTEEVQSNTDSSAQSTVTYATVLLSNPTQDHLHYKDGGGSSSSDEGNFSANNSDISGSFPGGLWELDDPRRSRSYNSVEELSETSEQEEEEVREEKELYYLGMHYPAEDEDSEEEEEHREEETETKLQSVVLNREDSLLESQPLLCPEDSSDLSLTCDSSLLYLPQYRTSPRTRQLTAQPQDSKNPAMVLT